MVPPMLPLHATLACYAGGTVPIENCAKSVVIKRGARCSSLDGGTVAGSRPCRIRSFSIGGGIHCDGILTDLATADLGISMHAGMHASCILFLHSRP